MTSVVRAQLTEEPISLAEHEELVSHQAAGAVVGFVGMIRDHDGGRRVPNGSKTSKPKTPGSRSWSLTRPSTSTCSKRFRRETSNPEPQTIRRLWRDEGLRVPQRRKKKRLTGIGVAVGAMSPIRPNVIWAMGSTGCAMLSKRT